MSEPVQHRARPSDEDTSAGRVVLDAGSPAVSPAVHELIVAIDEVDDAERELDRRVRRAFRLTATDLAALQFIDRLERRGSPARLRDIVDRFGVSSGTATEITHRLEGAHLVERGSDPSDARARRIRLTTAAAARLDALVGPVRGGLDDLIGSIPHAEQARLIELLRSVRDVFLDTVDSDAAGSATADGAAQPKKSARRRTPSARASSPSA